MWSVVSCILKVCFAPFSLWRRRGVLCTTDGLCSINDGQLAADNGHSPEWRVGYYG